MNGGTRSDRFEEMKLHRSLGLVALVAFLAPCASSALAANAPLNTLTAAEKNAGWKVLFDGKSLTGWRGVKQA
ncbi:MAG: hypothetical protein RIQ93_2697, partial [Verrucomicrobiota bacterium]